MKLVSIDLEIGLKNKGVVFNSPDFWKKFKLNSVVFGAVYWIFVQTTNIRKIRKYLN